MKQIGPFLQGFYKFLNLDREIWFKVTAPPLPKGTLGRGISQIEQKGKNSSMDK